MRLYKERKQVEKDGKKLSFTNFYLEIEINGTYIKVPIQPVNFGTAQNRKYYNILDLASSFKTKTEQSTEFVSFKVNPEDTPF